MSPTPRPPTYLVELADHGLDRDTIETLLAHGLATIGDLREYGRDDPGWTGLMLDDAARYRLVGAVWGWLGRPIGGGSKGDRDARS